MPFCLINFQSGSGERTGCSVYQTHFTKEHIFEKHHCKLSEKHIKKEKDLFSCLFTVPHLNPTASLQSHNSYSASVVLNMRSVEGLQVCECLEIACKIVFAYAFSGEGSSDLKRRSSLQSKAVLYKAPLRCLGIVQGVGRRRPFHAQVNECAVKNSRTSMFILILLPSDCNKVSDVPHVVQSPFLGRMWNFYSERPRFAFNLTMRILVSKALTSASATLPTGRLARAWMVSPSEGPQMPPGIKEMGIIVQEKDPRKNEGVQKIKMRFH